ncbi:MAG TPA: hypothetical protein PKI39_06220, partial [Synergistales bacterium]|nr:hypothetical protein [Synergistales bacterium]
MKFFLLNKEFDRRSIAGTELGHHIPYVRCFPHSKDHLGQGFNFPRPKKSAQILSELRQMIFLGKGITRVSLGKTRFENTLPVVFKKDLH